MSETTKPAPRGPFRTLQAPTPACGQHAATIRALEARAEQERRNAAYYRDLLVAVGELFGPTARTNDDGQDVGQVLVNQVPWLVARLKADRDHLVGEVEQLGRLVDQAHLGKRW